MPFDLAHHRGNGEAGEARLVAGVIAIDGLDHPELCHLHQIVDRFAPAGEPVGAVVGQPPVLGEQFRPQRPISCLPVPHEALTGGLGFFVHALAAVRAGPPGRRHRYRSYHPKTAGSPDPTRSRKV